MASSHSANFSRWACRLTILNMVLPPARFARQLHTDGTVEFVDEHGSIFDCPDWVYLHTLTFPNPEPSYDEARARVNSMFTHYWRPAGFFGVLAPQWGEQTNRLHFHMVTTKRPDAKTVAAVCKRYGFGKYDIRRRPAWRIKGIKAHEAIWYLARYVGRGIGKPESAKGSRLWSVFGAERFPRPPVMVRDVRITTKQLTVVAESPMPLFDFRDWVFVGHNLTLRQTLSHHQFHGGLTQMREITPEQSKKLLSLLSSGDIVGLGEYRFMGIETKDMEAYKNGRPTGTKESRAIVTHKVDFGVSCERREFDDLLPSGSDPKTVTPPAKSGDLVAVCVDGMRAFQGGTNYKGRIIKL